MTMKPDYGMRLKKGGYDASLKICFADWHIWDITVLGPGRFSTFGEIDFDGQRLAVSLDFGTEQLSRILANGPSHVRKSVEREIRQDPFSPRTIDLPDVIRCSIESHLGQEQRGQFESFVPLVVDSVS